MLKWLTILLALGTLTLGATSGYLAYEHYVDRAEITALQRANSEMGSEITKFAATYNANLDQGISSATSAVSADAKQQLDKLVADYNATSSELAGAKAQLSADSDQQKTIQDLVNQLNVANAKIAELQTQLSAK